MRTHSISRLYYDYIRKTELMQDLHWFRWRHSVDSIATILEKRGLIKVQRDNFRQPKYFTELTELTPDLVLKTVREYERENPPKVNWLTRMLFYDNTQS